MKPAVLDHPILVPTCIGCGARYRAGECAEGCDDQPLDLVEVADVEASWARRDALLARANALREVVRQGEQDASGLVALQRVARAALLIERPASLEPIEIVRAWGCPRCGRVDAPAPCIGVCIRRPVPLCDATELAPLAAETDALEQELRPLESFAGLVAHTKPRPGQAEATRAALQRRARKLVGGDSPDVESPAMGPAASVKVQVDE